MSSSSSKTTLSFQDTDYIYGFHCSKLSTFTKTVRNVVDNLPLTAFQIYLSNGRSYSPATCDIDDVLAARRILEESQIQLFIHGCLLYNLHGAAKHTQDPNFEYLLSRTIEGLAIELDIAAGLGARGVVVHPNSCRDYIPGTKTLHETIRRVLTDDTIYTEKIAKRLKITPEEFKSRRSLILENSAGEGTKRGGTLEELKAMIVGVPMNLQPQVHILIDTAHAFGAGMCDWGIPSEIQRFYREFDEIIGLHKLIGFHLNDSRRSTQKNKNAFFGSKKDRHENLGLGYVFGDGIGEPSPEGSRLEGLREFFLQARERNLPIIGEPPGKTEDNQPAPGGIFDWMIVCKVLETTDYPLIEIYE